MNDNLQIPDSKLCKDEWLRIVKPVERLGRLDKIPARPIRSKRDKKIADEQRIALSQKTFAMPQGYENINWSKKNNG